MAVWYHLCLLSERWWVQDSLFTKIFYKFCWFYRIHMSEKLDWPHNKNEHPQTIWIHLIKERKKVPPSTTCFLPNTQLIISFFSFFAAGQPEQTHCRLPDGQTVTDHNISSYIPYDNEKEKYESCKMFDPNKSGNKTMDCPEGYVHKGEQGPTIVTEVSTFPAL